MKHYYYADDDQQLGPFTLDELKTKRLKKSVLVWTDGMDEWSMADSVDELKDILVSEPPPLLKKNHPQPPIETVQIKHTPTFSSKYDFNYKEKSSATGYRTKLISGSIVAAVALIVTIFFFAKMAKAPDEHVAGLGRNSQDPDVYVAGLERNSQGRIFAMLWKNGIEKKLTDGKYLAHANSVFVSEFNVYVAGFEKNANGIQIAKLWKNGIAQNLTDGKNSANASSVYISGNDVYVAGYDGSVAKLWKNGIEQNLSGAFSTSWANSVYVSDNDVYVTGYVQGYGNYGRAVLWKNGIEQNHSNGANRYVTSVCVLGNDVYVVGREDRGQQNERRSVATLWKNGVTQNLTDGDKFEQAHSVYVTENGVYVAGEDDGVATLWRNGIAQTLSNDYQSEALSVCVFGNDVYVSGSETNSQLITVAKLWKNGVEQNLTNKKSHAKANSVFVKKP